MTDTQAAKANAPTHIAYQVREGAKQNYWTRIGAGWTHKDGKGFSIFLDCIPMDGQISVRLASEAND